jgi:hypothetical protein
MSPRLQFVGPALACMLAAVFLLAGRGAPQSVIKLDVGGQLFDPSFLPPPAERKLN